MISGVRFLELLGYFRSQTNLIIKAILKHNEMFFVTGM